MAATREVFKRSWNNKWDFFPPFSLLWRNIEDYFFFPHIKNTWRNLLKSGLGVWWTASPVKQIAIFSESTGPKLWWKSEETRHFFCARLWDSLSSGWPHSDWKEAGVGGWMGGGGDKTLDSWQISGAQDSEVTADGPRDWVEKVAENVKHAERHSRVEAERMHHKRNLKSEIIKMPPWCFYWTAHVIRLLRITHA